jgi:hypothetical protein
MTSRRSFLKNFGVVGAISAVALAAHQYNYEVSKPQLTDKDIEHLSPNSPSVLSLVADNRTPEEKEKEFEKKYGKQEGYYFRGLDHKTTHEVSMSVGRDNRLWIKVGDKWKRVALDTKV